MLISGLGQQLSFLEIDLCFLSSLFLSPCLCLTPALPSFSLPVHCLLLGCSCMVVIQQQHELGQRGTNAVCASWSHTVATLQLSQYQGFIWIPVIALPHPTRAAGVGPVPWQAKLPRSLPESWVKTGHKKQNRGCVNPDCVRGEAHPTLP